MSRPSKLAPPPCYWHHCRERAEFLFRFTWYWPGRMGHPAHADRHTRAYCPEHAQKFREADWSSPVLGISFIT